MALVLACGEGGNANTSVDAGRPDGGGGDARLDVLEPPKDADAPEHADADATIGPLVPVPANVVAVGGNAAAVVSWDWAGVGQATYTLLVNPGGASLTTPSPRAIVRGLTNGESYTFTVVATNPLGASAPSPPSNAVVPALIAGAPDTPSGVTATPGNGVASVTWPAPDDHGSAITRYTVMSVPDGVSVTTTNRTVDISGLANGTSYQFMVVATNAIGTSGASELSTAVIPAGPPAPPVNVTATRGDQSAGVSWTAPNNGGAVITGYTVTSTPPTSAVMSGTTSANVTGLTNGTSYSFTVRATNAKGTSSSSTASNAIVPAGLPGAPTSVTATQRSGSAVVYWTPPNDNGSPIVKYTLTSNPGALTAMVDPGTAGRIFGLTNGTSYTFTVKATNSVGTGAPSSPTAAVTPSATVCAETSLEVTADFAYFFKGLGPNPRITACRGKTLTLHLLNVSDQHPFFIRNANGTVASGVSNNGATGTKDIVWQVPADQADGAYYQCNVHPSMTNVFDLQ